ncbi:16S rRNA (guanine(966)-N(2))-methyltransferase RsmD [Eubacteriales bacterium OttesenSCG-928-A19]|nr:16S rRNA (guanine(966)-N(2))-methyltransferase RsmD [Eubacteriales bacterium OttesenSCG-928-A19]
MRIIAGTARGRTLVAPKGTDTRPTLDRVRESLFSILMPNLPDARVLDLFAGSGALGLEALSRGAATAVLVDSGRAAQAAVQRNIEITRMEGVARLLREDWQAALRRLDREGARFDIVFLDPPYRMAQAGAMLAALRDSGMLASGGIVLYEHAWETPPTTDGWTVSDVRRYGDTGIHFLCGPIRGGNDANGSVSGQL